MANSSSYTGLRAHIVRAIIYAPIIAATAATCKIVAVNMRSSRIIAAT